MERYHAYPSARSQHQCQLFDRLFQAVELAVDLDPYRLKGPFASARSALSLLGRIAPFRYLCKLRRCRYRLGLSHLDDLPRYPPRVPLFSVFEDDVRKPLLGVFVDDVERRQVLILVHPHVERRVRVVRKPSLGTVQLIGRHPQVHQHSVKLRYPCVFEPARRPLEVVFEKSHPLRVRRQPLLCKRDRVRVLVEGDQLARRQSRRYLQAVSRASQRTVDIYPVTLDRQPLDTFAEHHRDVGELSHDR